LQKYPGCSIHYIKAKSLILAGAKPFNLSTIQPFNPSTLQLFNSSTLQPFNSSTFQPFNYSTIQLKKSRFHAAFFVPRATFSINGWSKV